MPLFFSRCRVWWLVLALGVLSLSAARAVVLNSQEQAIADKMVNAAGQHRPFMVLDDTLTAVARARAADMGRRGYFDHVNPDGHGPNYMVKAAGYPLPDWWGNDPEANYIESIAGGRSTADATWIDWMNSTPHRDHLLANTSFDAGNTSYGVGYAVQEGSPFTYYWVVITCPPRPAPALAITAPLANARVTTSELALAGTTAALGAPVNVVYRLENGAGVGSFATATGTLAWTGAVSGLQPGPNTLRVRSLSATGSVLAEVTRVVTYVVPAPLTVAVAGSGSVTAGFLGTTERELARRYTITASPAAGWLFSGWTGSAEASTAALTFTMADGFSLTANFVANPFTSRAGAYAGLLTGPATGALQLAALSNGVFTGALRYAGRAYVLRGRFMPDGTAAVQIPRVGLAPLMVALQLDVSGTGGVSATIDDAGVTSVVAAAAAYRAAAGRFAGAGIYTISLPPSSATGAPQGSGFGTLTVDALGHARLTAGLADGTALLTSGTFSGDGVLPLYAALYATKGSFSGTLTARSLAGSDLDGTVRWVKPALPAPAIQPSAIDASSVVLGSRYVRPAAGSAVLSLALGTNNGELMLSDGNLPAGVTQAVTIDGANHVVVATPALPGLRVVINPVNGVFSGSFIHPMTGRASALRGVIFQRQNAGLGYFLGLNVSGSASLVPAP